MLETIIKLLKHFRNDKRGISNVIVVMLSLILVVVIVSNVVLWSYQMNQLDWQKTQEDITITDVASVRNVWSYNPCGYSLKGSTTLLSGDVSNLVSDNNVYMTFRSYYSGTSISDFVDNNTSNMDFSANKGTHSNFSAQQAGPDSVYDTLTEENTGGTGNWGITSSSFTGTSVHSEYRYMGGISPNIDNMKVTKLHIRYSGTGTLAIALYTGGTLTDPTGAIKRAEAYNVVVSTGWNVIDIPDYYWGKNTVTWIGWCHSGGRVYYSLSSADAGDFQSARGRWSQTTPFDADETRAMPTNPSSGSFSNYWYAVYVEYEIVNYEVDLEVQWTNVTYNLPNAELCIFGGTMGTEDIRVDMWNGSIWRNLLTDLSSGWNNISVSSYLKSSTFTIRFKGANEAGDTTQDSWNIDTTLLHTWSNQYTSEVEFLGLSNTQNWSQLNWTVDSAWTTGSVNVTLQLYNYTLGGYQISESGYAAYTSASTPNTDESKSQTIDVNPVHFRNSTGYWKMKITGVKTTDTQFDYKADLIEFKLVENTETIFTFKNRGSLTSHLIALWIIDSSNHKRYEISVFLNSGEVLSYNRDDISLPLGQYAVRVVTERGNIAIYANSS
jgi:hypothetical protein